jgi:hypothetical protein
MKPTHYRNKGMRFYRFNEDSFNCVQLWPSRKNPILLYFISAHTEQERPRRPAGPILATAAFQPAKLLSSFERAFLVAQRNDRSWRRIQTGWPDWAKIGQLFTLSSFWNWGYFIACINFAKNGLGLILGEFFTNSSGHPGYKLFCMSFVVDIQTADRRNVEICNVTA